MERRKPFIPDVFFGTLFGLNFLGVSIWMCVAAWLDPQVVGEGGTLLLMVVGLILLSVAIAFFAAARSRLWGFIVVFCFGFLATVTGVIPMVALGTRFWGLILLAWPVYSFIRLEPAWGPPLIRRQSNHKRTDYNP